MIHIFQDYSLDDALAASMFADRKQLFVDLLGWGVPVVNGRYEIDVYDGPVATYMVAVDDAGEHIGSLRLLPTEGPHILADLFAQLCDDAVPSGAAVLEITRLCLPTRLGAARRLAVRNLLISAMIDHALERDIATLTGVVTECFLGQVLAMGWRGRALGLPRDVAGSKLGAFRIDIDPDTRAAVTQTGIYSSYALAAAPARQAA